MEEKQVHAHELDLVGGWLCLDFANTVGWHRDAEQNEHLTSYAELVGWSRHVGILSAEDSERLLRAAAESPEEAHAVLARALTLREAIYEVFSAHAAADAPRDDDLAQLNEELSVAMARARLRPDNGTFAWDWSNSGCSLDAMLWPVVRSAADLLTSERLSRVRECADDHCGWLFLDMSRNRSRQWCDMKACGNRAKARRFYARTRAIEHT